MKTSHMVGLGAALGTLASVGGAYAQFRSDMRERAQALAAEARSAATAMGPIEFGREGAGPAALVIHGAGGGFDQGLYLGRDLLGAHHDLIAPSRFGYLGTAVPRDGSIRAQADAHAALLDALNLDHAIIAGVSAGAPSAVAFAMEYPQRADALILIVPRAYDPAVKVGPDNSMASNVMFQMVSGSADFAYWSLQGVAFKQFVRFLGIDPKLLDAAPEAERAKVKGLVRDILPLSARAAGMRNDGETPIVEPEYAQLQVPTLLISADDDLMKTAVAARYAAERIPDAELIVYPTGGHILVSRSEEVRAAIADFLTRRASHLFVKPQSTAKAA